MAETADDTDIGIEMLFQRQTAPDTWETFVEVVDFSPLSKSKDSVEFTHRASPERWREFKPGLKDAGEASLTYNLIPGKADDAKVNTAFDGDTVDTWRVTYPDGATLVFKGFPTAHAHATPMDDKMTGAATFKISGKPTLTAAA